jgi:hypothetical protein
MDVIMDGMVNNTGISPAKMIELTLKYNSINLDETFDMAMKYRF